MTTKKLSEIGRRMYGPIGWEDEFARSHARLWSFSIDRSDWYSPDVVIVFTPEELRERDEIIWEAAREALIECGVCGAPEEWLFYCVKDFLKSEGL